MGISGKSAALYLLNTGYRVIGIDKAFDVLKISKEILSLQEKGLVFLSEESDIDFSSIDLVVLSPGIPPSHRIYQKALSCKKKIIGEVELAMQALKNNYVIGITGTNGKTTVTLLVTHLLNEAGKKARALGNVGKPLAEAVLDIEDDIVVLELSSYQLETLFTPIIDAGVILNITPDHLDRYPSMSEYRDAKLRLKKLLKEGRMLYALEGLGIDCDTFGYSKSCTVSTDLTDIFVHGKREGPLPKSIAKRRSHDLENFLAAYVLIRKFGLSHREIENGFSSFKKPPHRVEFVAEVGGVRYYDDSKGTNLDAVVRAVESFDEKIVLIAGGVHKGASYKPWEFCFKDKVVAVFAIGEAKSIIEEDLRGIIPVKPCLTLKEAVVEASKVANPGSVVLLSPGCSSFDMFKDYAHRGDEFKRIVLEMGKKL